MPKPRYLDRPTTNPHDLPTGQGSQIIKGPERQPEPQEPNREILSGWSPMREQIASAYGYDQWTMPDPDVFAARHSRPGVRDFTPGSTALPAYQAGFWDDPQNIIRYYGVLKATPPDTATPGWLDPVGIEAAYKYLALQNAGKPESAWQFPTETDPLRQMTGSWALPPLEFIPDNQRAKWAGSTYSLQEIAAQSFAAPQPAPTEDMVHGIPVSQWEQLEDWQKVVIPIMNSGAAMGAATTLPMAALTTGDLRKAAIGAAIGAGIGTLATAGTGTLARGVLEVLNLPADTVERVTGTVAQLLGSLIAPDWYGDASEILNDLGATWQASQFAYEQATMQITKGRTVYLGQPGEQQLQAGEYGLFGLRDARRTISELAEQEAMTQMQLIFNGRSSASLTELEDMIRARTGFVGMVGDLWFQMFGDPLNVTPVAFSKIGGKLAKAGTPLAKAFEASRGAGVFGQTGGAVDTLRMYSSILRTMPMDEVADLGWVARTLGGVSIEAGKPIPTLLRKPGKLLGLISLTPRSRATEIVLRTTDRLKLELSGESNPEAMVQYVNGLANGNPAEVGEIARVTQTAEGAVFPLALRDARKKIKDFYENAWVIPSQQRAMLSRIAMTLEIDPYKLLGDIANNRKDADAYLNVLRNRLREAGDTQTLAGLEGMTGRDLMTLVDPFIKGSWVISPEEFKYRLISMLTEEVENWTTQWLGVKPDPLAIRLSNTIKNAQSLVLLSLNPNYLINNALNNVVTQAFTGTFGVESVARTDAFWRDFGVMPQRMNAGTGGVAAMGDDVAGISADIPAERRAVLSGDYQPGEIIRGASTKEGALNSIDRFFRRVGDWAGSATALSQRAERWSSRQAFTVSTRRAWRNLHRQGVGYRRMPTVLEQGLREMGIDPEHIYAAINAGMNQAQIERNLWDKMSYGALERFASPAERDLLVQAGLWDILQERTRTAKTPQEFARAFDEVVTQGERRLDQMTIEKLEYDTQEAFARVSGEGFQAAVEMFDRIWMDHQDFWLAHFDDMENIYRTAEGMTSTEARAYKLQQFQRSQAQWRRQWETTNARLLGVVKAMTSPDGGMNPTSARVVDIMIGLQSNWGAFFDLRGRLNEAYNAWAYGGGPADEAFLRAELSKVLGVEVTGDIEYGMVREAVTTAYRQHTAVEAGLRGEIDEIYSDLFGRQFGSREAADAWRVGVNQVRGLMIETQMYFRTGDPTGLAALGEQGYAAKAAVDAITGGKPVSKTENPNAAWKRFNDEIYRKMVVEEMTANQQRAGEQWDASQNPAPRPPEPPAPPMAAMEPELPMAAAAAVEPEMPPAAALDQPLPPEVMEVAPSPEQIALTETEIPAAAMDQVPVMDVANVEVPAPDPVRPIDPALEDAVFRAAEEYGYVRTTKAGATNRAFLKNILRKYLGVDVERLDEVNPQDVTLAFERRRVAKLLGEEQMTPEAIQRVDDYLRAERVQEWARETESRQQAMQPAAGTFGASHREAFANDLREVFNLPEEQANALMTIFDGWSRYWAKKTGRQPEEFYTLFAGMQRGNQGQLMQQANQAWYYSQLMRTIEAKMPNKATPQQIMGMLRGQVKADELEWTGFEAWLWRQQGPVTRQQVLDYLQENQVQIEDRFEYDERQIEYQREELEGWENDRRLTEMDVEAGRISNADEVFARIDEQIAAARALLDVAQGTPSPKYKRYSLPGGSQYRELLITLPSASERLANQRRELMNDSELRDLAIRRERALVDSYELDGEASEAATQEWRRLYGLYQQRLSELTANIDKRMVASDEYESPHFGTRNILAHTRLAEHVDVDGRRVLLIEEIQSDWHQAARRGSNVPPAPFSGSWEELTLKRIMRWAAENGYERVAWTTGDIQVERYSLSQQLDTIEWAANEDGSIMLIGSKGERETFNENVSENALADKIGVEAAKRIQAAREAGQTTGRLEGEALEVGGSGMRAFYDQKIPNIVRKMIKKWGGTLGQTTITAGDRQYTVPAFDVTPQMRTDVMQGQPLFQPGQPGRIKGATSWLEDGRALIYAMENADVSTAIHEVAHVWLTNLPSMQPGAFNADMDVITGWLAENGIQGLYDVNPDGTYKWVNDRATYREAHEMFARAVERYFADGVAPKPALQRVFDNLKSWFVQIYRVITGSDIDVKLSDGMRQMMDRWLSVEPEDLPQSVFTRPSATQLRDMITQRKIRAVVGDSVGVIDGIKGFSVRIGNRTHDIGDIDGLYDDTTGDMIWRDRASVTQLGDSAYEARAGVSTDNVMNWANANRTEIPGMAIETDGGKIARVTINGQELPRLGQGAERSVFDMGDRVLRIDSEENMAGSSSTAFESYFIENAPEEIRPYLPQIYASGYTTDANGKVYHYQVVEKVTPLETMTPEAMQVRQAMDEWAPQDTRDREANFVDRLGYDMHPEAVRPIVDGFVLLYDRHVPGNYGVTADGRTVLIDLGANLMDKRPRLKDTALFQGSRDTYAFGVQDPGKRYQLRYRVVDLNDLVSSHSHRTFAENPDFPQELQPRDRARAANQTQIMEMINRFDPLRVIADTRSIQEGAPIINTGMQVESGNGRTMALRLIAEDYPKKWQEYLQTLTDNLDEFGLTADDMEGIERPVLVRERLDDTPAVDFVEDANSSAVMTHSAGEQASIDARALTGDLLRLFEMGESGNLADALMADYNARFVSEFIATLPVNERAGMLTGTGALSNEGVRRIEAAMFAKVFPGEAGDRLLRAFAEGEGSMTRLNNELRTTLPAWVRIKQMVETGMLDPSYDITDDVVAAVDLIARLRKQKMGVQEYLKQINAFDDVNDTVRFLLAFFDKVNKRNTSFRKLIFGYAERAAMQEPPGQASFIPRTQPGELLSVSAAAADESAAGMAAPETVLANTPPPQMMPEQVQEPAAVLNEVAAETGQPVVVPPKPVEEPQAVAAPLGAVEAMQEAPLHQAERESWMQDVTPALRSLQEKMTAAGMEGSGGYADQVRAAVRRANPEATPEQVEAAVQDANKQLKAYLGGVYQDMKGEKLAAMRYGESMRDFTLLNYGQRYGFDNALTAVFPYQFWTTRSMLNWALRAIDRPAMLSNYARLKMFLQQGTMERDGFPSRLKRKMGINLPFLPDWMGEGVFIDPMRQIYPFENFYRPFQQMDQQRGIQVRKTQTLIQGWLADEQISDAEAQEALTTGKGMLWEKAWAQSGDEMQKEIANPFDFMQTMMGASLPIQWAYNMARGTPEKIGQLPVTRMVQSVTGGLGIGGPSGINIESPARKALGLPEVDQFYDYRVDRMLAGMAADGEITTDQAMEAVMNRQGEIYEAAQRKVAQMGAWQYFGAPLALDFFPEGEQTQRQLREEYQRALDARENGDNEALTRFFDEYPEYQVQLAAFQDPEERMRKFMISEVWDRYMQMPSIHRKQVAEQLGSAFTDTFLNKETRDYDSINSETLALWSQMLGGRAPGNEETPNISLNLAPQATADAVTAYYEEMQTRFPGIGDLNNMLYSLPQEQQEQFRQAYPQLAEYTKWKNKYLADHPDILPWVQSEKNELYGLPAELQSVVYGFRAAREERFPNLNQLQDEYFALDKEKRSDYLKANPELAEYWEWRKQYAALYPQAASYILGDDAVSKAILGDQDVQQFMYMYRQQRDAAFPNIEKLQDQYFKLTTSADKRKFLRANPELTAYWDWRQAQAALYPAAAPLILSEQTLSKSILGDEYEDRIVSAQVVNAFSPELLGQVMGNMLYGESLTVGARKELQQHMKAVGFEGSIEEFMDALKPGLGMN